MKARRAFSRPLWIALPFAVWLGSSPAIGAGDVSVRVKGGGSISIVGDREDNAIQILDTGGQVEIRGIDGTSVDLDMTGVDATAVDKLSVQLRGGDDSVQLDAAVTIQSKLQIATGSGDDQVEILGSVVDGKTVLSTGGGDDDIDLEGTIFNGKVTIKTGSGDDIARLGVSRQSGCDVPEFNDRLKLGLGGGSDWLDLECGRLSAADSSIASGGSGWDTVGVPLGSLVTGGVRLISFEMALGSIGTRQLPCTALEPHCR